MGFYLNSTAAVRGKAPKYTDRILAVGIAYDKEAKKHDCKIEIL